VLCQQRFNFSQFDTEAANFYLLVEATEELNVAIW
jgi:hypothetical protein